MKISRQDMRQVLSSAINASQRQDGILVSDLQRRLAPFFRTDVLPTFRDRWKDADAPKFDDGGQGIGFSDLWPRLSDRQIDDESVFRLIALLAGNAANNSAMTLNRDTFHKKFPLGTKLEKVIFDFAERGTLSSTFSQREGTSPYSGKMVEISMSGFRPKAEIDSDFAERPADAVEKFGAFRSGEMMIVTNLCADGNDTDRVMDAFLRNAGNVNHGKSRQEASLRAMSSFGLSMNFLSQDQDLSLLIVDDGVMVVSGDVDGAESLAHDGLVHIGDRADFEDMFGRYGVRDPAALCRELIARGNAVVVTLPEGSKMRLLTSDHPLREATAPDVMVICAAGTFPMPAVGDLGPEEAQGPSPD